MPLTLLGVLSAPPCDLSVWLLSTTGSDTPLVTTPAGVSLYPCLIGSMSFDVPRLRFATDPDRSASNAVRPIVALLGFGTGMRLEPQARG